VCSYYSGSDTSESEEEWPSLQALPPPRPMFPASAATSSAAVACPNGVAGSLLSAGSGSEVGPGAKTSFSHSRNTSFTRLSTVSYQAYKPSGSGTKAAFGMGAGEGNPLAIGGVSYGSTGVGAGAGSAGGFGNDPQPYQHQYQQPYQQPLRQDLEPILEYDDTPEAAANTCNRIYKALIAAYHSAEWTFQAVCALLAIPTYRYLLGGSFL
jgi:hypothetical protein